ncbi:MAG: 2-deoxy-5-keto-D-gluconate 6-phosphate aldolase domain-containing protein [Acidimicrobiales bacterium]
MVARYATPLYLLAFDHRASFERGLFAATPPLSPQVRQGITKAKELIFSANQLAVEAGAPRNRTGVLVDEEFGALVARAAKEAGVPLAMPVEHSGQDEFDFEYGERFAEHIEVFDPTFVKVLVRYNPEGDAEANRRQTARLARLSKWLRAARRLLLFELLVPPTTAQSETFDDHYDDYDRQLRPALVVATIAELQAGGVEADIWKVEGLDSAEDAAAVVAQARTGGREHVNCIVLGRGVGLEKVAGWLATAAGVPGFAGFAVGRTLWHDALAQNLAGRVSEPDTVRLIAERYSDLIGINEAARITRDAP